MVKVFFYMSFFVSLSLVLPSCGFYIPRQDILVKSSDYIISNHLELHDSRYGASAIDSASIKLVSWNTLSGCRQNLKKVLSRVNCTVQQSDNFLKKVAMDFDILLLQEAYLDSKFVNLLYSLGYSWDMAVSFYTDSNEKFPSGVLTASNVSSLSTELFRVNEPLLPTPKAILLSTYHLHKNNKILDEKLLVVNVHAILFGYKNFKKQLELMAEKIKLHNGPLILAGDFNTFTDYSYSTLRNIIELLDMTELSFNSSQKKDFRIKSFMGFGRPYDLLFYKDLEPVTLESIDLNKNKEDKVSDHNPIFAEFKIL